MTSEFSNWWSAEHHSPPSFLFASLCIKNLFMSWLLLSLACLRLSCLPTRHRTWSCPNKPCCHPIKFVPSKHKVILKYLKYHKKKKKQLRSQSTCLFHYWLIGLKTDFPEGKDMKFMNTGQPETETCNMWTTKQTDGCMVWCYFHTHTLSGFTWEAGRFLQVHPKKTTVKKKKNAAKHQHTICICSFAALNIIINQKIKMKKKKVWLW